MPDQNPVRIVTDSAADMPPEQTTAYDTRRIPLLVTFGVGAVAAQTP